MTKEINLVLGTAGHIDHGKTSLVRALTGVETDRLPEEQTRGITIELGFAPLVIEGAQLSVVDVPGHEKLVRTMVSGASGIDLVLLVVAADEGVMPQTREHIAICELLGIHHAVVALTKCDLVEKDLAELAELEISEFLEPSILSNASIVHVSSRTGQGIQDLQKELLLCLEKARATPKKGGPPRLFIDRVFSSKGFGSIVTGTLVGGNLNLSDEIELYPSGHTGRIRGLQSFGKDVTQAKPGIRCAVNIQGIDLENISRGQVLSKRQAIYNTDSFDVSLNWLPDAPDLKDRTSVSILNGTRELLGRISPLGGHTSKPEDMNFARIHLESETLPLIPGDRVVFRGFSRNFQSGATFGGGVVIDISPVHMRHSNPDLVSYLTELLQAHEAESLILRIKNSGYNGIHEKDLALFSGVTHNKLKSLVSENKSVIKTSSGVWLFSEIVNVFERTLLQSVRNYHAKHQIRPGIPQGTLSGELPKNSPKGAFELVLGRLLEKNTVNIKDGYVFLSDHMPLLSQEHEVLLAHIRAESMSRELEPLTYRDWIELLKISEDDLRDLLSFLVREGTLIRAPGNLWFDAVSVNELRDKIHKRLISEGSIDTKTYKKLIGTTRKYAVPLMELFDGEGLTLRRGEIRVGGPGAQKLN